MTRNQKLSYLRKYIAHLHTLETNSQNLRLLKDAQDELLAALNDA